MLLLLLIVIGIVLFLENCLQAVPREHRKIPPKLVWLLELPWALALLKFALPAFISNVLIHLFISLAILFSFESYFAARNVPSRLFLPFCAALCVTVLQLSMLGLVVAREIWPGRFSENFMEFSLVLMMGIYALFLYTTHRLKERVLQTERDLKKAERTTEARQHLRRPISNKKGPAKKEEDIQEA